MTPLSHHWADIAAVKIVKSRGEKDFYVLASGITPSGQVHVGNFREVITVDLVARALLAIGRKVRFIYSWDNFDTLRKVPKNLPDPKAFTPYLKQPIARIPDPWGKSSSYAQGRMDLFESELARVGISPQFIYQEKQYSEGKYGEMIQKALKAKDQIATILNQYRTEPLSDQWLPTSIYCESCHKDQVADEVFDGEWQMAYSCTNCGHKGKMDIRTSKHIKLAWRTDWPMRWAYESVDFEPGGKDHSSDGGSYDTGRQIVKAVYGAEPPEYLQYDFVMIKGGTGKMSSSSGELFTLSQVLEVYEPQLVRWLFANQRPNHDFALAFDEDVIRMHDEFDKAERQVFADPAGVKHFELLKRTYELSLPDGHMPTSMPKRASFRELCNRLQICSGDIERTFQIFYQDALGHEWKLAFVKRAQCALNWLQMHAPDGYRFELQKYERINELKSDPSFAPVIQALESFIKNCSVDTEEVTVINQAVYDLLVHPLQEQGYDSKAVFERTYQIMIARSKGPRLPAFLKEVGAARLREMFLNERI